MDFSLSSLIGLLAKVPSAVAMLPEFKATFDAARSILSGDEAAIASEAYADRIADNDEGHARLQEKLAAAAQS